MMFRSANLTWIAMLCAAGCNGGSNQNAQDAAPTTVVVDDFEGDTSGWTLAGSATIENDTTTSSQSLHLNLASGTCGASSAERRVTIPANAGSIRLRLSGAITADSDNQIWFTLREDTVSVYGLAIPPTPLSTAREENWCVPAGGPGQTVTLSFVVRTQSACNPMDAWIDDIVFSADATGCTPMPAPI